MFLNNCILERRRVQACGVLSHTLDTRLYLTKFFLKESLDRSKRDAVEVAAEEEAAVARKGRPAGGAKKGNKNKSAKKNSKSKKGKKGKKKAGKKKSGKKGGNKKGKKSPKARTTRAFVTGLGTLVRSGDVLVRDSENGKMIKADFLMGPVDLKVSRKVRKESDVLPSSTIPLWLLSPSAVHVF